MKKIAALILAFTLTAGLTACSNSESPLDSSAPVSDNSESSANSENSTNSDNQVSGSQSQIDPETKALIDSFALDSFTAPDGSTVNKSEAVYAAGDESGTSAIGFDFSYMRYAKPIFGTTLDDPTMIDWETLEFKTEPSTPIESPDYFKVKAGDTLENGLTIESAKYWINPGGQFFSSEVVLSGELALEGVLHCIAGDPEYVDAKGDLLFFADTTKSDLIPTPKGLGDFTSNYVDAEDKFAAVFDGAIIRFGNISEFTDIFSDTFTDGNYVKAKVTMKDIRLGYKENGGTFIYAEPVAAENP